MAKSRTKTNERRTSQAPRIRQIPIGDLVARERNARTHTNEQVELIARSIEEFGFLNPVLVNSKNEILAGHGRLLAAEKLGLKRVPCVVHSHLSKAQERAYVIADNRLAELAGWDEDLLGMELGDLKSLGFEMGVIGFSAGEIDAAIAKAMRTLEGNTDPNATPDPEPGPSVSIRGDIWALGSHRLSCGDCTNRDAVARLLEGRRAPHLMVTDPPYGVNYDASWRRKSGLAKEGLAEGKVSNDDQADWREAWALFPGDVVYVWHSVMKAHIVAASLDSMRFIIRSQIIWLKSRFAISRGAYHVQHEPAFYAVREGAESDHWNEEVDDSNDSSVEEQQSSDPFDRFSLDHETLLYAVREKQTAKWVGGRKQSTVWQIDHIRNETGHSTQKPVDCMKRPIENNSRPGDLVYEPFAGSGTTIIAAEMTGRSCLAMELEPSYVDLCIRRWQDFTGRVAVLEETGQSWDEVKSERLSIEE